MDCFNSWSEIILLIIIVIVVILFLSLSCYIFSNLYIKNQEGLQPARRYRFSRYRQDEINKIRKNLPPAEYVAFVEKGSPYRVFGAIKPDIAYGH